MDKLTIEECDDLAKRGFCATCMANVPTGEKLNFIGQQLAHAMRENERLQKALDKKGCYACDPAKYYAVVGDPRECVTIPAQSNKESVDETHSA